MGFNNNPHVAKASAAEQKATDATDESARAQAWFDAARLWERAADREKSEKKASEYRANAARARGEAEAAPAA
jgi:hypothetical protein